MTGGGVRVGAVDGVRVAARLVLDDGGQIPWIDFACVHAILLHDLHGLVDPLADVAGHVALLRLARSAGAARLVLLRLTRTAQGLTCGVRHVLDVAAHAAGQPELTAVQAGAAASAGAA